MNPYRANLERHINNSDTPFESEHRVRTRAGPRGCV
ncbi:MAG: hypothetical protein CSA70_04820 [Rhodobacterales bacterium]|nr:MAG: hypothetical protein CSA70_04820 [Rhodobacterales bacterium]